MCFRTRSCNFRTKYLCGAVSALAATWAAVSWSGTHLYRRAASSIGIIYLSLPTYCASYDRHSAGCHPRAPSRNILCGTDRRRIPPNCRDSPARFLGNSRAPRLSSIVIARDSREYRADLRSRIALSQQYNSPFARTSTNIILLPLFLPFSFSIPLFASLLARYHRATTTTTTTTTTP